MSQRICLDELCREKFGISLASCNNAQIYRVLCELVQRMSEEKREEQKEKAGEQPGANRRLYYLCAEFLLGRLLRDRMIHLGIDQTVCEQLEAAGKSPDFIEEEEKEPSLGNGGLGRLAACFLDSMAAVGLPGDGLGLLYHFGLFRQSFVHLKQCETPDPWLDRAIFFQKQASFSMDFCCMGQSFRACMYDLDIIGQGNARNTLHLFDLESVTEQNAPRDHITFDMENLREHLTWFLYPDDSTDQGRRLRLCQQFFLSSCAGAWIWQDCQSRGWQVGAAPLHRYAAIQINDTHPALIIPILIQMLCRAGVSEDQACEDVRACCAYTNHTVMREALEQVDLRDLEAVAPELLPLIRRLDERVRKIAMQKGVEASRVALIVDQRLAMAHLAVHFSDHVNGVAALHTALLRSRLLADFYQLYPERFSNKTNGISPRRWLMGCNRPLTQWISSRIGDDFMRDASHLEQLEAYCHNDAAISSLHSIKSENKRRLDDYLYRTRGIRLNLDGVFDVQIKRLHEYKRQHLSALYLMDKLLSLRRGEQLPVPLVSIFAAKAASAYELAKDILHLLLCLQQVAQQDPICRQALQIVVVDNYNVEAAEYLVPAAEISEQISLASTEASGTGNMKMMMNGALTLGTRDGANIEILERVGEENMFLFGMRGDEALSWIEQGRYDPQSYYQSDEKLKAAVDFIISEEMLAIGDAVRLRRLHDELLHRDRYMSFADFSSYCACRDRAIGEYTDRKTWGQKMLINISRSGYFSSDRTVLEYNRDIWHLSPS